jgi:hypothetical protein
VVRSPMELGPRVSLRLRSRSSGHMRVRVSSPRACSAIRSAPLVLASAPGYVARHEGRVGRRANRARRAPEGRGRRDRRRLRAQRRRRRRPRRARRERCRSAAGGGSSPGSAVQRTDADGAVQRKDSKQGHVVQQRSGAS